MGLNQKWEGNRAGEMGFPSIQSRAGMGPGANWDPLVTQGVYKVKKAL